MPAMRKTPATQPLFDLGLSVTAAAARLGVERSRLSEAVNGLQQNRAVCEKFTRLINKLQGATYAPEDLFPHLKPNKRAA